MELAQDPPVHDMNEGSAADPVMDRFQVEAQPAGETARSASHPSHFGETVCQDVDCHRTSNEESPRTSSNGVNLDRQAHQADNFLRPVGERSPANEATDTSQGNSLIPAGSAEASSVVRDVPQEPRLETGQGAKPQAAPFVQVPEEDAITLGRQALLEESGLLARQAEISESIILMEQQLRQAELINQLMTILGPDTPIEIRPGEFRVFRDTPAGRRIANEITLREAQDQAQLLQVQIDAARAQSALEQVSNEAQFDARTSAGERQAPLPAVAEEPPMELRVLEILGSQGRLEAVVEHDGHTTSVRAGSIVGGRAKVISVEPGAVEVDDNGRISRFEIAF
ncbi:MAG: type IV pilus biogenesis protein PilP [Rhodobacteraceae bacterium]|nr:type IV pilus biogenesis protein PilP [Paracoccaceae bacterium]